MRHIFLEGYSGLDSIVHRMDPRVKVISLISFILFIISTPPEEFPKFSLYFLLIFSVMAVSRIPFGFILKRSLLVVPFVLFAAISIPFAGGGGFVFSYSFGLLNLNVSYAGLEIFLNVLAKSWLSVLTMVVLVSTTTPPNLLKGFRRLKLPAVMVMLISFMYRYVSVLVNEALKMKRARDSRASGGNRRWHITTIGNIIGNLFIRSYERGERIYVAMLSRGFTGEIQTLDDFRIKTLDVLFSVIFLSMVLSIKLI